MTREEAEKYAENMTYREAIYNLKQAKSVPYRKATFIKVNELLNELEQEPRKGHWKHIQYEEILCCSECGCRLFDEQTYIPLHYCPNCGAKMAESEE